jgi:hypothetical protein
MPAMSVPSSEIPPYQPVVQVIGACSGSDISGYVTACDSSTSTQATCTAWFMGASTPCVNCLFGPVNDAGAPTGQGGIWLYQGGNIGPNYPGCLALKGMSGCADAYQNIVECLIAAGCGSCMDPTSAQACQNTIFGPGGACQSYVAPYQSACPPDYADGGLLANGGACSNPNDVLSVICGNGSGDGG